MVFHSIEVAKEIYDEVFFSDQYYGKDQLEYLYYALEKQIASLYEELSFCRSKTKEELFDFLISFSEKTLKMLQEVQLSEVA